MTKSINDGIEKLSDTENKLKQFSDILDGLETTEDKKKMLWKEIYQNALDDRTNAQILFDDLMLESRGNPANHAYLIKYKVIKCLKYLA